MVGKPQYLFFHRRHNLPPPEYLRFVRIRIRQMRRLTNYSDTTRRLTDGKPQCLFSRRRQNHPVSEYLFQVRNRLL